METPPVSEELRLKITSAYEVCQECGIAHGAGISRDKKQRTLSTWHDDICDICEKEKRVTEFRDFGYHHPRYNPSSYDIT